MSDLITNLGEVYHHDIFLDICLHVESNAMDGQNQEVGSRSYVFHETTMQGI